MAHNTTVQSEDLAAALDAVRAGRARLFIPAYARVTIIDKKTLAKFDAAGQWLIKTDGNGFRLKQGRGSVYLFAGQLKMQSDD